MCNIESFTCLKEQITKVGCRTENVAALCQLFFTKEKIKDLAFSIHEDELTIMKKTHLCRPYWAAWINYITDKKMEASQAMLNLKIVFMNGRT